MVIKQKIRLEGTGFTDRFASINNRYPYLILYSLLSLALILRVLALLSLKDSIYFDFLLWDERVYHNWAVKIAEGTAVTSTYGFAPFPAYVMAFVYRLFSPDIVYIRFMNIVLGVFTCYIIYLIGKEMVNRKTGLFACLVAALYKPFIFYSIVPLKTSLSVCLFALAVYLLTATLNRHSMTRVLLLGVTIGLMLNVRPNCLVIIPLMPLFILWNMHRNQSSLRTITAAIIIYTAGISIAITPFAIRKYNTTGELRLTTGQSGYALYVGNNLENPDPYFRPVSFASPSPFEQGAQFIIEASRRAGKKLSPREAGTFWTNEVIRTALEQPDSFVWRICQKILVFFNRFEAGDHYHIGFVSDYVKFFKFPFFSLWLILPFGMAGMAMNMPGSRKSFALSITFMIYASTLILFFTSTRFRLPLLVILIPFAVICVQSLYSWIKEMQSKQVLRCSVILVFFFILEFLPVQATDDLTPYLNTHGIILSTLGNEAEAMEYWEKASAMNTQVSSYVNISLAGRYGERRDMDKALFYLEKVPDDSFAASYKYEMIGDIMLSQQNTDRALASYDKSLEINSGRKEVREKIIKIYWRIDREKALNEYEKLQYISSFYSRDESVMHE